MNTVTFKQVNRLRNRWSSLFEQDGSDAASTLKAYAAWRAAAASWVKQVTP